MKASNTAERLKKIMHERGLKQIDIIRYSKPFCEKYNIPLNKNDLSQYISGKTEPGQRKLTILSEALNVSPVWLMGFDVPMEKEVNIGARSSIDSVKKEINNLANSEMNKAGKETLINMVDFYHEQTIKENKED